MKKINKYLSLLLGMGMVVSFASCGDRKNKGFDIVPISELIHRGEFEMDHEGRQIPKT